MSPGEVKQVLSFCASVDGWMRAADPDAAALMVAGWSDLLHDVPLPLAMEAARGHYSEAGARSLQPGDVLGYAHTARRAAKREHETEHRELLTGEGQGMIDLGASGAEYVRDVVAALAAGEPAPPMPADLPRATKATDLWERRCLYHEICACDHTACRDGWADAETVVTNGLRKQYPAVQRCPHCHDALRMAEERGIARKPSRAARR